MGRKKFKQIKDKSQNRTPQKLRETAGQALIEFVLGLMIVIAFFFFYVKMAAVFAVGNFIHYATFMAARAYSSSADTEDQQKQNAEAVLQKMVAGRWKPLLKAKGGDGSGVPGATIGDGDYYKIDSAQDNWNQGVTFSYETKISLYPWSKGSQAIIVPLTSESWMRREDSVAETQDKLGKVQGMTKLPGVVVEWDNGF